MLGLQLLRIAMQAWMRCMFAGFYSPKEPPRLLLLRRWFSLVTRVA